MPMASKRDYYEVLGVRATPTRTRSNGPIASWPCSIIRIATSAIPRRSPSSRKPPKPTTCCAIATNANSTTATAMLVWKGPACRISPIPMRSWTFSATFSATCSADAGVAVPSPAAICKWPSRSICWKRRAACRKKSRFPARSRVPTVAATAPNPARGRRRAVAADGHGVVIQGQGFFRIQQTCGACGGQGAVITDPCRTCHGRGAVEVERALTVNIPPGVDNDVSIRLYRRGRGRRTRRTARRSVLRPPHPQASAVRSPRSGFALRSAGDD